MQTSNLIKRVYMTLLIKQVMSLCDVKTVICVSDSKFFICNVGCQAYNMSGGNSCPLMLSQMQRLN